MHPHNRPTSRAVGRGTYDEPPALRWLRGGCSRVERVYDFCSRGARSSEDRVNLGLDGGRQDGAGERFVKLGLQPVDEGDNAVELRVLVGDKGNDFVESAH